MVYVCCWCWILSKRYTETCAWCSSEAMVMVVDDDYQNNSYTHRFTVSVEKNDL
jgi:hypothetical protein